MTRRWACAAAATALVATLVAGCGPSGDDVDVSLRGAGRSPVFPDPSVAVTTVDDPVLVDGPTGEATDPVEVAAELFATVAPAGALTLPGQVATIVDGTVLVVTYPDPDAATEALGEVVTAALGSVDMSRGTPEVTGLGVPGATAVQVTFIASSGEGDRTRGEPGRVVAVSSGSRTLVAVLVPDDPELLAALSDALQPATIPTTSGTPGWPSRP